jgi:hypothetical protein
MKQMKKTPKKRQRARPTVVRTPASRLQPEPLIAPVAAPPSVATTDITAESREPIAKAAAPAESREPIAKAASPAPAQLETRTWRSGTVALAAVAALVVAALALPRRSSPPVTDNAAATAEPEPMEQPQAAPVPQPVRSATAATPSPAAVSPVLVTPPTTVSERLKKAPSPKPEKIRIAESANSDPPIAAATPAAETSATRDAATTLPAAEAKAAPAPTSTETVVAAPVTITGCLEVSVNQDEFRLTDTEGVDAPKSRSWRTGFLRKRAAPVALVDAPDSLALQAHVGQRVAATGLLTTRDLKVSSLRVVGPCS